MVRGNRRTPRLYPSSLKVLIGTSLLFAASLSFSARGDTAVLNAVARVAAKVKVSTYPLDFGNIEGEGVYFATTKVTVKAPSGMNFNIAIDGGLHYSAGSRYMLQIEGAGKMPYQVFQDSGLTRQWGDSDFHGTFPFGKSLPGIGVHPKKDFTVYGKLTVEESAAPGLYQDMLTVTIHY